MSTLDRRLKALERTVGSAALPTYDQVIEASERILQSTRAQLVAAIEGRKPESAPSDLADIALVKRWERAQGIEPDPTDPRDELIRRLQNLAMRTREQGVIDGAA